MLQYAEALGESGTIQARYCLIGTGMGASAVAQTLAAAGEDVLFVEAGGLERDADGVIRAEQVGRPFGIPVSRCIELGGTSNQWHGICGPLDESDFAERPWIPHSGWPMDKAELDPFYVRAAALLELDDPSTFEASGLPPGHAARLGDLSVDITVLRRKLVQVRKPPVRWKARLVAVARERRWRCLLHASALALVPAERGDVVDHLLIGAGTRTLRVRAEVFVVCAGGLETPRLLLNSRTHHRNGIGNDRDLVGRFLMDHPVGHFCKIGFIRRTRAPLYASMPLTRTVSLMSGLALTAAQQAALRLPNHCLWIRPCVTARRVDDDMLYSFLAVRGVRDLKPPQVWAILSNPDILSRILVHRFGMNPAYRYGDLFFMTEQLPHPDSRVDLSPHLRDSHGYPVARIDWRLTEADFGAFEASARVIIEQGLRSSQYSLARLDDPAVWRKTVASAAHHLGTARMAADPSAGVVDRDLRVFGMQNLYVCDGSVFPTVGSVNPSLTITALGIRLGEHLLARRRLATSVGQEAVVS